MNHTAYSVTARLQIARQLAPLVSLMSPKPLRPFLPPMPVARAMAVAFSLVLACGFAPTAAAQTAPGATQSYTVEAGDSLQGIAQKLFKYGGSWQELRDLNGIVRNAENRIYPGQTLSIKSQWLEPPKLPIAQAKVITAGQGASSMINGSANALLSTASLVEGSRIKTGPGAGATIELEDKSRAQLAPNTELELVQLRKDGVTGQLRSVFRLISGSLQMAVPKLLGASPDRLVVRTSTATVGIRGTVFRVNVLGDEAGTTSEVLEGRAELDAGGSPVPLPGGFGSKAAPRAPALGAVALLPASSDFVRLPLLEMKPTTPTTAAGFEWASVPGAARYQVTLSRDSQFEEVISTTSTAEAKASFAAVPRGYLFIKVRAYDSNEIGGFDLTRSLRM